MTIQITAFREENSFLSNFYPKELTYNGRRYRTLEHAFQAAKTLDPNEHNAVASCKGPGEAKRAGRRVTKRADWDEIRRDVMLALLRIKFEDSYLKFRLIGTGDAELIEGNTWGDVYWGCVWKNGQWVGENWLGKLLMQVRREIRS